LIRKGTKTLNEYHVYWRDEISESYTFVTANSEKEAINATLAANGLTMEHIKRVKKVK